jgi:toxin ParE1/3/4
MSFRLSARAEADLVDIYLYGVAEFGLRQAEAYQDRLDHAIELIGLNPKLARLRLEIDPPVRVHRVQAHIIIYHIDDDDTVRILRVRHGNEDWITNPTD